MNTQTQTQMARSFWAVDLLGLIFITLKLTGYIAWSWWWVTAPFWGLLALYLVLLAGVAILAVVVGIVTTVAMFFRKRK